MQTLWPRLPFAASFARAPALQACQGVEGEAPMPTLPVLQQVQGCHSYPQAGPHLQQEAFCLQSLLQELLPARPLELPPEKTRR